MEDQEQKHIYDWLGTLTFLPLPSRFCVHLHLSFLVVELTIDPTDFTETWQAARAWEEEQ